MEFKLKSLKDALSVTKIANLHFFEFEKNFSTKNDRHSFYELVFVSSGTMRVSSDNYDGKVHKNQMIIHKPNETHSLSCTSGSSPTVIIIGFECYSPELEGFSARPFSLNENSIKTLAEIVKEGRNVFSPPFNKPTFDMKKNDSPLFASEQLLKNLLEYLLIKLIREYNFYEQLDKDDKREYNISINEIVQYVDDNFLEKITIDELAFIFRTNRATLCKEFKSKTGLTLLEYINAQKIKLAKQKISASQKTFTEIAYELNFESIHYFTRFFKKQTGLSPKEYRQLINV